MFQYSFSKTKTRNYILLAISYFRRIVSVPARGTEKDSLAAVFFHAYCLRLTGGLIPQTPWVGLRPPKFIQIWPQFDHKRSDGRHLTS